MNSLSIGNHKAFYSYGWAAAAVLAFAAGCATAPTSSEDPGVAAIAILGESSDNADEPDLGRMRGNGLGLVDGLPGIALKCDVTPTVATAIICGVEQPANETYSWTDCRMGMAGRGKGKGQGGPVSNGSIQVRHDVSGTTEDCDATTTLEWTDTTDLDIARQTPRGRRMSLNGTVTATSTHNIEAQAFTKQLEIAVQREMIDADGATLREVGITGTASVSFSVGTESTMRVIDGTLTADLGDGSSQSILLAGVTRLDPDRCRWPVAGSLVRVEADETRHELQFSSDCGLATLDGSAVDLNEQRGNGGHGMQGKGKGKGSGDGSCLR